MRIKHKRTRWEGTVDPEGWKVLERAGKSKDYEVLDRSDSPKIENIQLPEEVTKFQGRLQDKEKQKSSAAKVNQKGKTGEQPADDTQIN